MLGLLTSGYLSLEKKVIKFSYCRETEREKRLCFVTQDSLQFLFVTSSGGFAQYVQSVELLLWKADSYLISGELS